MNMTMETSNVVAILAAVVPIVLLHFGLMIFSIIKLRREGVGNLNKTIWLIIIIFVEIFGSVLFLTLGRKDDEYDSYTESEKEFR